MIGGKTKKSIGLMGALFLLCAMALILLSTFISPAMNASAATSGHSNNNCTVEMNNYIKNQLGDNYSEVGTVKNRTDSNGKVIEKWQLIVTKQLQSYKYVVAYTNVSSTEVSRKISTTLKASSGSSNTSIRGSYFSAGGGVDVGVSIPIVDLEISEEFLLMYNKDITTKSTTEQAQSISYTFTPTSSGRYNLYQVIQGYEYKLIRFTSQPVYDTRDVYDSKGNYSGTETYVDHYAWQHYQTMTFSTNVSDYFTVGKS